MSTTTHGRAPSPRLRAGFTMSFILCLALSLACVQLLRLWSYRQDHSAVQSGRAVHDSVRPAQQPPLPHPAAPRPVPQKEAPGVRPVSHPPSQETMRFSIRARLTWMAWEIPKLIVDRWVGLEGVMAVSSWADLGPDLLLAACTEDPKRGVKTLYQRVAGSRYEELQTHTFLTTVGLVGFYFFSGSFVLVIVGTALVAGLAMLLEAMARWLTRNPFAVSICSISVANSVAQLNFPYLTVVFLAQTCVGLAGIWLIERGARQLYLTTRRSGKGTA